MCCSSGTATPPGTTAKPGGSCRTTSSRAWSTPTMLPGASSASRPVSRRRRCSWRRSSPSTATSGTSCSTMSPRSPSRWRSRWTATWRRRSGARRGSFRTRRRPRTTVGPSTSSRASSPPPRWSRHASYRRLVAIDPRVDIGHVHLKVSDIDRALGFYRDVLGFEETTRYGDQAVFISAGGYHHHIGLNTWESLGGSPPPPGTTGLYHVAIRYPTRAALADALRRVLEARIPLSGASDHGVSEAIYLHDPDENGIELYWDRPKDQWPREGGKVTMYTRPLDLEGLLAETT